MPNDLASAHTMTGPMSTSLELDDIQRGVLHQRPSPYVGTYLLLRIDNPDAGRRLVRRLCPVVEFAQSSPDLAQNASISVGFTYQGLKALGVPRDSLASFAPEFRQGMAARAAELGDVGDGSPTIGSNRSEAPRSTSPCRYYRRMPLSWRPCSTGRAERTKS
jgi:deferrochelatase/peroxidase EfeB